MKKSHLFDPKNIAALEREDRKLWQNPEEILEKGNLQPHFVAADVGCGSGYFTLPLAQKVEKVYAIDAQQEMLDYIATKVEDLHLSNIELVLAATNEIPLQNEQVDFLISVNTLHEFADKDRMMMEMYRVLKPKGLALICDFQKKDTGFGPPVAIRLSKSELLTLFERHGFHSLHNYTLKYHYLLVFFK